MMGWELIVENVGPTSWQQWADETSLGGIVAVGITLVGIVIIVSVYACLAALICDWIDAHRG
jgi:hypothetical protein